MKILVIILLIAVLALPLPFTENQGNKNPHDTAADSTQPEKSDLAKESVESQKTSYAPKTARNYYEEARKGICDPVGCTQRINAISTLVIAIFAIVTAIIIGVQVCTTRKLDRPWIFLVPKGFGKDGLELREHAQRLDWIVQNRGKTVAIISEIRLRCHKHNSFCGEEPMKVPPEYRQPINFPEVPVAPNGYVEAYKFFEDHEGHPIAEFTAKDIEEITTKGLDLVAYGLVKYKDQFGKSHVSRFCYWYITQIKEFRTYLAAPAEYHRCT